MALVDLVRNAAGMCMVDEDGHEEQLELLPPMTDEAVAALRAKLPCPLPQDVEELLRFSSGFANGPLETVEFAGEPDSYGMQDDIFPCAAPVAHDGFGNYWIVDLVPAMTGWGPILYVCHDPPVVVYQADSLEPFLVEVLRMCNPPHESAIEDVHEKHSFRIWRENPGVMPAAECRNSEDGAVRALAQTLTDDFLIVDMRDANVGDGFSWGRFGNKSALRRHGHERIFAYQQKTWLQRMLGR